EHSLYKQAPADERDRSFSQLEKRTDTSRDHHADEQSQTTGEIDCRDGRVCTNAILAREDECTEPVGDQVHRPATGGPQKVDAENRSYRRVRHDVGPTFAHVGPVTTIQTSRLLDDSLARLATRIFRWHEPGGISRSDKRERIDDERRLVTDVRRGPATQCGADRHQEEAR